MLAYFFSWVGVCVAAILVAWWQRDSISLFSARYWRFLGSPWKVVMFAIGLVGIVAIAPFTGDPTWDYFDAAIMAVLTYAFAPWSIGTLYRGLVMRSSTSGSIFLATVLWFFSASWSYDGYLLLRDGAYPPTWKWNLLVSGGLFLLAGLFWNFDWSAQRGTHLAFQRSDWPTPSRAPFRRIAVWCLPIAIWVGLLFLLIGLGFVG